MARKKEFAIDRASLGTVDKLLAEMETKVVACKEALESDWTLAGVQKISRDIFELAKALRDKMPENGPRRTARTLCQHAYFVKKYAADEQHGKIESNLTSLEIDLSDLKEHVERMREEIGGIPAGISDKIAAIRNTEVRSYLQESCKCLSVGANRASVVMSGCSLESLVRSIYVEAKGQDSSKFSFARLIEVLEGDKSLPADQAAIISICRVFRNLTGHPLDFNCTREDAESLLRLAVTQLRKNEDIAKQSRGGKG